MNQTIKKEFERPNKITDPEHISQLISQIKQSICLNHPENYLSCVLTETGSKMCNQCIVNEDPQKIQDIESFYQDIVTKCESVIEIDQNFIHIISHQESKLKKILNSFLKAIENKIQKILKVGVFQTNLQRWREDSLHLINNISKNTKDSTTLAKLSSDLTSRLRDYQNFMKQQRIVSDLKVFLQTEINQIFANFEPDNELSLEEEKPHNLTANPSFATPKFDSEFKRRINSLTPKTPNEPLDKYPIRMFNGSSKRILKPLGLEHNFNLNRSPIRKNVNVPLINLSPLKQTIPNQTGEFLTEEIYITSDSDIKKCNMGNFDSAGSSVSMIIDSLSMSLEGLFSLIKILKGNEKITTLKFMGSPSFRKQNLFDQIFKELKNMPFLINLTIVMDEFDCYNANALADSLSSMKHLKTFYFRPNFVAKTSKETDGIKFFFRSIGNLSSLEVLHYLPTERFFITDELATFFSSGLKRLVNAKYLNIQLFSSKLTIKGVMNIFISLLTLPLVVSLDLGFDSCLIYDWGALDIAMALQNVNVIKNLTLNFSKCKLTETGLNNIFIKAQKIESLNNFNCTATGLETLSFSK